MPIMMPAVDDDQELVDEQMEMDADAEEEANNQEFTQNLTILLPLATDYLEDSNRPSPEEVDWATGLAATALDKVEMFASRVVDRGGA
ncbi:hypothetical protein E2562_016044 [Oryza meyeriana var. granulata]|uniref:Uncharacterized protein n=1 Tax=Oryza meyeriana var. granulata TaxID=110450 RepID=A0A6G1BJR0_9ORYZ|nr:hypothetical protein E2562_016044 [Oryza meyeriana var. granulata]